MKIYSVLVYATYSEKTSCQLHVKAETKQEAYDIVLNYMKRYNRVSGFEYYSEYGGEINRIVSELETVN